MSKLLGPGRALIFRITHRDNIPCIFEKGLHCQNSEVRCNGFVDIGCVDLIGKRNGHPVLIPPGGTLGDYIPFYFTPFSPMLLNIKTGRGVQRRTNEEIVILASALPMLSDRGLPFLFTDRHAYLATARFFSDLARLDQIDWAILQSRDFQRDPNDPGKFERYQAEALVHKHLPLDALIGAVCYSDSVAEDLRDQAKDRGLKLTIAAKPGWYF